MRFLSISIPGTLPGMCREYHAVVVYKGTFQLYSLSVTFWNTPRTTRKLSFVEARNRNGVAKNEETQSSDSLVARLPLEVCFRVGYRWLWPRRASL
jgi:hypothetical protein